MMLLTVLSTDGRSDYDYKNVLISKDVSTYRELTITTVEVYYHGSKILGFEYSDYLPNLINGYCLNVDYLTFHNWYSDSATTQITNTILEWFGMNLRCRMRNNGIDDSENLYLIEI